MPLARGSISSYLEILSGVDIFLNIPFSSRRSRILYKVTLLMLQDFLISFSICGGVRLLLDKVRAFITYLRNFVILICFRLRSDLHLHLLHITTNSISYMQLSCKKNFKIFCGFEHKTGS